MRRQEEEALSAKEKTQFIYILGALLWLCLTRLGDIADVALLQQEVTHPTVGHIATSQSGCCSCEEVRTRKELDFSSGSFSFHSRWQSLQMLAATQRDLTMLEKQL